MMCQVYGVFIIIAHNLIVGLHTWLVVAALRAGTQVDSNVNNIKITVFMLKKDLPLQELINKVGAIIPLVTH